ncbi:MAG: SpoIID/LytB domain-containing protein [Candidatus Krumholzibacteriota bacterium]|nr:SpoIID/LytB domain-containing protein [Candidatus Krumholzibacteriota bacterium]
MHQKKTIFIVTAVILVAGFQSSSSSTTLAEAEAYFSRGRYLEAIDAYLTINRETETGCDEAIEQVADLYNIFLGDEKSAEKYYRILIDQFSDSQFRDDALYNLSLIKLKQGSLTDGKNILKRLLREYPSSPRAPNARFFLKRLEGGRNPAEREAVSFADTEETVRVLIVEKERYLKVSSSGKLIIKGEDSKKTIAEVPSGALMELSLTDRNTIRLMDSDLGVSSIILVSESEKPVQFKRKEYIGNVKVTVEKNGLAIINLLPLEKYLKGVVPSEMPASWPVEALAAQAIIARTYTLFQISKRKGYSYDVYSTTGSQVYGGVSSEKMSSDEAVDDTRGIIVSYEGKPALTYYHSNSGGYVEDDRDVWGTDLPYLSGFKDEHSITGEPVEWSCEITDKEIEKKMGLNGRIKNIRTSNSSPSGRINELVLVTCDKNRKIGGNRFRLAIDPLKIKSTLFEYNRIKNGIRIEGRGFGHGVGLSQYGAKNMADNGFDYREILGFYYPGTSLKRLYY